LDTVIDVAAWAGALGDPRILKYHAHVELAAGEEHRLPRRGEVYLSVRVQLLDGVFSGLEFSESGDVTEPGFHYCFESLVGCPLAWGGIGTWRARSAYFTAIDKLYIEGQDPSVWIFEEDRLLAIYLQWNVSL
jgi:hypothetical protein